MNYMVDRPLDGLFPSLMLASKRGVNYKTLIPVFLKHRCFLVTIGDTQHPDYWQRGDAFLSLYTDRDGFRVFDNSMMVGELNSRLSEEDWKSIQSFKQPRKVFSKELTQYHTNSVNNALYRKTLDDFVKDIKDLTDETITIYRVHIEASKAYLEEIMSYAKD